VRDAEARLERELSLSSANGEADVSLMVLSGDPGKVIVDQASAMQSDLIVMGLAEHATLRAIFSGTTIERVVRAAPCPVLTVKTRPHTPYASVVVAFDASPAADRALRLALRISPPAVCTVLYAGDRVSSAEGRRQEIEQAVRETVAALQTSGTPPAVVRIVEGESVAEALQREIANIDPDLVILGTHARVGVVRFALGSIAATLLETLPRDVMVVR
jgi:nucleotide-binding universal stress UspA family protein